MQSDKFEWDDEKAASNEAKHKISFTEATFVFDDLRKFIRDMTKPEYGEERFLVVGSLEDGRTVAVVYTMRGARYRIISVRRARDVEQRTYRTGASSF